MSSWTDAVTSLAAVLGVSLAAWKWVFQEMLRRRREIPSIDGDIEIDLVDSKDAAIGVFINSIWNNKGTVPIFLNPKKTRFSVYEIDMANAPLAIDQSERAAKAHASDIVDLVGPNTDTARLVLDFHPVKDAKWFMLEPKTKSRIQATILLEKDKVYELRCLLVAGRADQNWFRKRLFSTSAKPKANSKASAG